MNLTRSERVTHASNWLGQPRVVSDQGDVGSDYRDRA